MTDAKCPDCGSNRLADSGISGTYCKKCGLILPSHNSPKQKKSGATGVPKGFAYENGLLVKYTPEGRKRKNWKQDYRKRSRKKLVSTKECQKCGSTKNLTVHHKIPLREKVDISKENLIKVCRKCHDRIENGETIKMVEFILLDNEEKIKRFLKAIEGYGLLVELQNEEVIIKIPQGKMFYEEFIGSIPAKEETTTQLETQEISHGV